MEKVEMLIKLLLCVFPKIKVLCLCAGSSTGLILKKLGE